MAAFKASVTVDEIEDQFSALNLGSGSERKDVWEAGKLKTPKETVGLKTASVRTVEECWKVAQIEICKAKQQPQYFKLDVEPDKFHYLVKYGTSTLERFLERYKFGFEAEKSSEHLVVSCNVEDDIGSLEKSFESALAGLLFSIKSIDISDDGMKWHLIGNDFLTEICRPGIHKNKAQVMKKSNGPYCIIGSDYEVDQLCKCFQEISGNVTIRDIQDVEFFENLQLEKYLRENFPKVEILIANGVIGMKGDLKEKERCITILEKLKRIQSSPFDHEEIEEETHNFLARPEVRPYIDKYLSKRHFKMYWVLSKTEKKFYLDFILLDGEEKFIKRFLEEIIPEVQKDLQNEEQANQNKNELESKFLSYLQKPKVRDFINKKLRDKVDWYINKNKLFQRDETPLPEKFKQEIKSCVVHMKIDRKVGENREVVDFVKIHHEKISHWREGEFTLFYATVDLQEKLNDLFAKFFYACSSSALDLITFQCKDVLPMPIGFQRHLNTLQKEDLDQITSKYSVTVCEENGGLHMQAMFKKNIEGAKKEILDLRERVCHIEGDIKVGKIFTQQNVENAVQKLEQERKCTVTFFKSGMKELQNIACWSNSQLCIAVAKGDIEYTVCDALVCMIDENCQPVGESTIQIFRRGGFKDLEEDAKKSKNTRSVYLSLDIKKLNCRGVFYVPAKNLNENATSVWKEIVDDVNKNQWNIVCFPVDFPPVTDASLGETIKAILQSAKNLEKRLDFQLCIRNLENLAPLKICKELLPEKCYVDFSDVDYGGTKCFPSPIKMMVVKDSLLDVAMDGKVHVIVNSTNKSLNLEIGQVSSQILTHGGEIIRTECQSKYPKGICYGKIATTGSGNLACHLICHGVLFGEWVSTGNFSLKILSALVRKCLAATDEHKLTSIAFPALGTGKLSYPYLQVARTMVGAVNEYGRHFPTTNIQEVLFTLQESESIEAFGNVLDSDRYEQGNLTQIEDAFSIQDYWFLDTKIQEDLVVQLMADDDSYFANKPTEARIKLSLKDSKDKGGGNPVDFSWCLEKGYYTRELFVNKIESAELIKGLVLQSFQELEKKRISSVIVDIRDLMDSGAAQTNALYEAFKELESGSAQGVVQGNKSVSGSSNAGRYLKELKIFVNKSVFAKLMGDLDARQANTQLSRMPNFLLKLTSTRKDKIVYAKSKRSVERDFTCCIFGDNEESIKSTLGDLQRQFERKVKTQGHWCVLDDHKSKQGILLSSYNNAILNAEEGTSVDIGDVLGHQFTYNIEDHVRTSKSDNRHSQELLWIEGVCEVPENLQSPVWCVYKDEKTWKFLDAETNKVLNKVADNRGMNVESKDEDGKSFVYDLNYMWRQGQEQRDKKEDIIQIIGVEDNSHTRHNFNTSKMNKNTAEEENRKKVTDIPIFDVVYGTVICNEKPSKKKILDICESVGCKTTSKKQSLLEIQGTLSQVMEANDLLKREIAGKGDESFQGVVAIPMTEREYKAFLHFGKKAEWFKKLENIIDYDKETTSLVTSKLGDLSIEIKMKALLETIKGMASEHCVVTQGHESKVKEFQQQIEDTHPNVCLFIKDNDIEIISESYEDLQAVKRMYDQEIYTGTSKIQAKPRGSRAGRRFNKTESESEADVYTRNFNKSDEASEPKTTSLYLSSYKSQVMDKKMDSGLVIKIYTESITKLNVDCIVNAANENLMHGGGVAYAISEAAGFDFDRESTAYVAKHGPIPVGKCCVTGAGKLHYKYVIHTVGPKWSDYSYDQKKTCLDDLQEAVEVTFREAEKLGMRSIALPAISSGIFGVPKDKCVEQYKKAVITFDGWGSRKNLQEIHFVDRDSSMVSLMQSAFSEMRVDVTQKPKSRRHFQKTENEEYSFEDSQLREQNLDAPCSTITVSESVHVKIMLGSIAECKTDGIVCPQDEKCMSNSRIVKSILKKVSDVDKDSMIPPTEEKMRVGRIMPISVTSRKVPWSFILHVVSPRWNKEAARAPKAFEESLKTVTKQVLEYADSQTLARLAFPLLGTGEGDPYQTPLETCARMFCEAVEETQPRLRHLKEIVVVVKEESVKIAYLNAFEKIQKPISTTNQSKSLNDLTRTLKGPELPKEDEKCCICMDTPTNPQRLKICGHMFCKECIKQCFTYKPACPSCGQFYGKMTGDQPEGSISFKRGYQRLEGFSDCNDCIIVTYTFYSGRQGPDHPNPGKWYKGISRSGYLPNNERGRLVAKLLNVAFSRRLVFTIGHSRTTGQEGVITWNDIHHKTKPDGGPQKFGYPDSTYLDRVLEELVVKGVTPESADDPEEYKEYSNFVKYNNR